MNEQEVLSSTYTDTCTVYRPVLVNDNGEDLFLDKEKGEVVYSNIPCALSSITGGKLQKEGLGFKVECDYYLFVNPEINVQVNDFIVVERLGKIYKMVAGDSDRHCSHNRIFLKTAEAKI